MHDLLVLILNLFDLRLLLLSVLIFTPLEFLFPAHRGQKILRPTLTIDTLHYLFSGIVMRLGLMGVIVVALAAGEVVTPDSFSGWAASRPLWLQVLLCTLIADLGFYAAHRLMHEVPALWRFHAIHHSSEQLDWFAAFRVHPVDQVFVKGTSLLPIFVLGFSMEAIAIASVIYSWQALLIHSNVRLGFGKAKWLVASPEFHHWHHANEPEAYNKNYAGQLPLWDMLFGTLHMPSRMPEKYGTDDEVPKGYLQQIAYPFRRPPQQPNESQELRAPALSPD